MASKRNVAKKDGDKEAIGSERLVSDKRQLAGMLMVLGFCAVIQPIANVAVYIQPDGATPTQGIQFAQFFGGVCLLAIGAGSVAAGFSELVYGWANFKIYGWLALLTQTAWIPYITGMVVVGQAAATGKAFIPSGYDYNEGDVHFVGAMGILGIFSYGFAFVGGIAFQQFSLFAFHRGKPESRNVQYYKGRLRLYCFFLYVAGISQTSLAAFSIIRFGGAMEHGPIRVGFYVISTPLFAFIIGLLQILGGVWGTLRSCGKMVTDVRDFKYQALLGLSWVAQLGLQVIAQPGLTDAEYASAALAAPAVASMSFGLSAMPSFLDGKMKYTADPLMPSYYGLKDNNSMTDESSQDVEKGSSFIMKKSSSVRSSGMSSKKSARLSSATSSRKNNISTRQSSTMTTGSKKGNLSVPDDLSVESEGEKELNRSMNSSFQSDAMSVWTHKVTKEK